MSNLKVSESAIPGFYIINLDLHSDNRGWFKENYQKEKLEQIGLPKFSIVQNNISFNKEKGVTRGLHAEPWDKYISVATGSVFGAWVDVRKGSTFGKVITLKITPNLAVYVPRGVANGYQTLEKNVAYTYLVNEHWSEKAQYTFVNISDPQLNIQWPIAITKDLISEKDAIHPLLKNIKPMEL